MTSSGATSTAGPERGRASFPVRRLGQDYADVDRYFYASQPIATLFALSGSFVFPDGEMFFVRSVRHFKDAITDPGLLADVRAFTGQEASHANEHRRANRVAERIFGIEVEKSITLTNFSLAMTERLISKRMQLAATAALEHFTGVIAATLLEDDHFAEEFTSPAIRKLVMWHAVEESEHRAVAFDTYQAAGGNYAERTVVMASATAILVAVFGQTFLGLLAQDGQLTNVRSWRHFLSGAARRDGLLRPVVRRYWSYYKPSFHPHDEDTSAVEERWRTELALAR